MGGGVGSGLTWSLEKAVCRTRWPWATNDCHSSRKKKSAFLERQPKKSIVSVGKSRRAVTLGQRQ